MKRLSLLISLFFICYSSYSQNLIRNPYFDRDSNWTCFSLQHSGWEIGGVLSFHKCRFTPTIVLSTIGYKGLPEPYIGLGYVGVTGKKMGSIRRSFLNHYLLDSLEASIEYIIEFRYRPWSRNSYHIDLLEATISNDTVSSFNYTNHFPTVSMQKPITDTTQWLLYSKSFIAKGNEWIVNIGNVSSDSQINTFPNYPNAPSSFNVNRTPVIFIDAVFLYKATDTLYTVTLPKDTLLCPGETLDLVAVLDSGFKLQDTVTTYLWSTGSTDSNITVSQPGTYWVQSTINKRFVQTDTIVVTYFNANYTLGLPDSIGFCENENANLLANAIPYTKYYWSNGDTTRGISIGYSTTLQLTAVTPCYTLQESVKVYQKQCETYIYIPNAFTPNGDGNNDFFEFFGVPQPVSLLVFDRWGNIVYQNQDYQNDWDGTSSRKLSGGQDLPLGVYSYFIEYLYVNPKATQPNPVGSKQQIRGTVTLVR